MSSSVGNTGRAPRPSSPFGTRRRSRVVPVLCAGLLGVPLWAAPALADDAPAPVPAADAPAVVVPAAGEGTRPAAAPAAPASVPAAPVPGEPVGAAPVKADPVAAAPVKADPVAGAPVEAEHVAEAPVKADPVVAAPVTGSPVAAAPVDAGPGLPTPDDVARPDLSVVVVGPPTGWAGGEGAYTVTVTNAAAATAAASGFTVAYVAPTGQTIQSVRPAGGDWACALSTEASCTWHGALAPGGQTPSVTVVLAHGRRAAGTLSGTVRVSAADEEVHLADNARSVSTTMQAPELSVAVGAPDAVAPGAPVRVVLAVTNTGPGWASGFSVAGALPEAVQVSSVAGTGFDCEADLRSCTYTDVLAPGLTASVAFDGTLAPSYAGGPLRTTARLGEGGPTASAVTAVTALPPVTPPVAQPVTQPVAQPVTQPVAQPVTRPGRVTPAPRQQPVARVAAPRRGTTVTAPAPAPTATQPARQGTAPAGTPAALPFTGSRADDGLTAGVGMLLSGLLLTLAARRRRTA